MSLNPKALENPIAPEEREIPTANILKPEFDRAFYRADLERLIICKLWERTVASMYFLVWWVFGAVEPHRTQPLVITTATHGQGYLIAAYNYPLRTL